ncbi:MAG: HD domain-containing protein [Defluviitaleaceae bacterium]|nr:HD domain-containing protein [Defluviitaleaceae bacterium]
MVQRLEVLRGEIDKLLMDEKPKDGRYLNLHLYGTSSFCALLAVRRGLDGELAAAAGMLHDVSKIASDDWENHAVKSAKIAGEMLGALGLWNEDEILLIADAISRHTDKEDVHEPFDELLKDADVMAHSFYNPDYFCGNGFPDIKGIEKRYQGVLAELGCEWRD